MSVVISWANKMNFSSGANMAGFRSDSHIYTYIYTYIHTYMHACMHTYIRTYTNTHTKVQLTKSSYLPPAASTTVLFLDLALVTLVPTYWNMIPSKYLKCGTNPK